MSMKQLARARTYAARRCTFRGRATQAAWKPLGISYLPSWIVFIYSDQIVRKKKKKIPRIASQIHNSARAGDVKKYTLASMWSMSGYATRVFRNLSWDWNNKTRENVEMEKSEVYPFDVVRRFFVSRWMRREETLKEVATYKFIHKKKVINTLSNVHSLKFIKIECSIAILFLNRIFLSTFLNPFYNYITLSSNNIQTFF